MLGQLVFQVERLPPFLAALVVLGLACWLLWTDFETRLYRAFALVLVLKAFYMGLLAFGTGWPDLAIVLRIYFLIGIPFAALYFALVFRAHYSSPEQPRSLPGWPWALGLTLAAAFVMVLYALARDLYRSGPIFLFHPLGYAAFAFIALVFIGTAVRLEPGHQRTALLLGGLALSLEPLYQATFQTLSIPAFLAVGLQTRESLLHPLTASANLAWFLPIVLLAVGIRTLLRSGVRADPQLHRAARRMLVAMSIPAGSAVLTIVALLSDRLWATAIFIDLHWFLDSLWLVTGTGIIVYAIVNHMFLDVQTRVRRTIRTSTLIAALLVVFFIMKELLEEVLEGYWPFLPGLLAALIAVVLLHPLLLLVARFLRTTMPRGTPLSALKPDEQKAVYRSQVEIVWMDGVVTKKERRLLDRMRERLQLDTAEARRIEKEVMGPGGGEGTQPRRRQQPTKTSD